MTQRIALFGQAAFARDVLERLLEQGHEIVAVYAPPEREPGADPLLERARAQRLRCFQHRYFRRRGEAIAERVAEFRALDASLNVLAYVTAILPPEIVDAPANGSLCFHPSLLPRFRGGAAIPWQIILGEAETGVTVFRPDAGVDTGPIVVQRGGIPIGPTDTAASLYYEKLYPLGVEAMAEAVQAVDAGTARFVPQDERLATFQGLVTEEVARVDWARPAAELDRLIRGCDPQPGAHTRWKGGRLRLYGARLAEEQAQAPPGTVLAVDDAGMEIAAVAGRLRIARVRLETGPKTSPAEAGLRPGEGLGKETDR